MNNDKILIAYFMHKGHDTSTSKRVAADVATALLEKEYSSVEYAITPVEEYPTADKDLFAQIVKAEKERHYRPALTGKVGRFKDYQNIVLIAPNWYNDFPMAVYTFLDDYDFSGKRILPIVVHGGDGGKKMVEDLRGFLHKCDILPAVEVEESADDADAVKKGVDELITVMSGKKL